MAPVAILSPGYSHHPGGVSGHTGRLARSWSSPGHSVEILEDTDSPPSAVAARLAHNGASSLLIQYVPFLYGRRGLSGYPERVARACRAREIRVTTFVHEPWVPPSRLPWIVLSPLQRWQLHRLLGVSDAAATPVPAWVHLLGPTVAIIHVGSTLGEPSPTGFSSNRLDSPLVFSPFAAGLNWSWIEAAAARVGRGLTIVGATLDQARQHPSTRRFANPTWNWLGRLAEDEVLKALSHASLVLAPFVDGLTGRRTSAMAALSTGARLLSSRGPLFDPAFSGGPVAVADSRDEFASAAATIWDASDDPVRWQERLRWYESMLSPARLDERLRALVTGTASDP